MEYSPQEIHFWDFSKSLDDSAELNACLLHRGTDSNVILHAQSPTQKKIDNIPYRKFKTYM